MSVNTALIRYLYPPHRLGRGLGTNALIVGVSFAVGPTVASLILSVAAWPWLFAVNVPLGLLALGFAWPALPHTERGKHNFDPVAALLNVVTFAALIFALGEAAQRASTQLVLSAAAIAVVFGLLLIRREAGHPAPMLPVDLFKRPVFALSAVTAVCSFAAQGLAFVSLPFYFEDVLHRSQVETGFLMTPWPVVVALAAPLAGSLSDRYPPGLLGAIGLAVMSAGMASLALLPVHPHVLDIGIRMAICGAGFGFFQSPNLKALDGERAARAQRRRQRHCRDRAAAWADHRRGAGRTELRDCRPAWADAGTQHRRFLCGRGEPGEWPAFAGAVASVGCACESVDEMKKAGAPGDSASAFDC